MVTSRIEIHTWFRLSISEKSKDRNQNLKLRVLFLQQGQSHHEKPQERERGRSSYVQHSLLRRFKETRNEGLYLEKSTLSNFCKLEFTEW